MDGREFPVDLSVSRQFNSSIERWPGSLFGNDLGRTICPQPASRRRHPSDNELRSPRRLIHTASRMASRKGCEALDGAKDRVPGEREPDPSSRGCGLADLIAVRALRRRKRRVRCSVGSRRVPPPERRTERPGRAANGHAPAAASPAAPQRGCGPRFARGADDELGVRAISIALCHADCTQELSQETPYLHPSISREWQSCCRHACRARPVLDRQPGGCFCLA